MGTSEMKGAPLAAGKTFSILSLVMGLSMAFMCSSKVYAESTSSTDQLHYPGVLLSQFEGDDAYDPFSDYSEFEESAEEEADINFFRNGRFFTLGFIGGYRSFTETLGGITSDAPTFGLFSQLLF